jgi:hypothetical protein
MLGAASCSQSPCGGRLWLPGNGVDAMVRGGASRAERTGVETGGGGDLPIPEELLFLFPHSYLDSKE